MTLILIWIKLSVETNKNFFVQSIKTKWAVCIWEREGSMQAANGSSRWIRWSGIEKWGRGGAKAYFHWCPACVFPTLRPQQRYCYRVDNWRAHGWEESKSCLMADVSSFSCTSEFAAAYLVNQTLFWPAPCMGQAYLCDGCVPPLCSILALKIRKSTCVLIRSSKPKQ